MKVTPSPPFETSCGLWVLPVRGVTTECRTRRVKSPARLRRAGFFNEDFNIYSTSMIRAISFDQSAGNADSYTLSALLPHVSSPSLDALSDRFGRKDAVFTGQDCLIFPA